MFQDRHILDSVRPKDIIRFCEYMLALVGQMSKTPYAQKSLADLQNETFARLCGFLNHEPKSFSISELHGQIQIDDIPMGLQGSDIDVADAFIFFMLERNLRRITFFKNIAVKDFSIFIEKLATNESLKNLAELLSEEGVTAITIEQQVIIPKTSDVPSEITIEEEPTPVDFEPFDKGVMDKTTPEFAQPIEETDYSGCRMNIDVFVGPHRLDGATVKFLNADIPSAICRDQRGVFIDLEPGEYEFEVRYEDYRIKRRVKITGDEKTKKMVVDLQQIFDY
jgi:hypothetical protein